MSSTAWVLEPMIEHLWRVLASMLQHVALVCNSPALSSVRPKAETGALVHLRLVLVWVERAWRNEAGPAILLCRMPIFVREEGKKKVACDILTAWHASGSTLLVGGICHPEGVGLASLELWISCCVLCPGQRQQRPEDEKQKRPESWGADSVDDAGRFRLPAI